MTKNTHKKSEDIHAIIFSYIAVIFGSIILASYILNKGWQASDLASQMGSPFFGIIILFLGYRYLKKTQQLFIIKSFISKYWGKDISAFIGKTNKIQRKIIAIGIPAIIVILTLKITESSFDKRSFFGDEIRLDIRWYDFGHTWWIWIISLSIISIFIVWLYKND